MSFEDYLSSINLELEDLDMDLAYGNDDYKMYYPIKKTCQEPEDRSEVYEHIRLYIPKPYTGYNALRYRTVETITRNRIFCDCVVKSKNRINGGYDFCIITNTFVDDKTSNEEVTVEEIPIEHSEHIRNYVRRVDSIFIPESEDGFRRSRTLGIEDCVSDYKITFKGCDPKVFTLYKGSVLE